MRYLLKFLVLVNSCSLSCVGSTSPYDFFQTYSITHAVQKICEDYKCKPVEGMLSHQLKQFRIDGEKTVIQNPNEAQKKEHEKFELEVHEVYAMDVLVSTGEGVVS